MSMHGSDKKDLSRKLTQHTLGEVSRLIDVSSSLSMRCVYPSVSFHALSQVLQELGVDNIEDDYQSSDEEKEDYSPPAAAASQRMKPSLSRYQSNGLAVPAHTMPTSLPTASFSQRNNDSFHRNNGMQLPMSGSFNRPVSRPNSFHHGSQKRPEVQHATVADYYDMSKLSEEEQISLTLKLSEQESKYGVNMLDELKAVDPSEIADLEACGYNFGQAVEMIFNRRRNAFSHDSTSDRNNKNGWSGYRSTPPGSQSTSVKRTTSGIAVPSAHSPAGQPESSSPTKSTQPQLERPLSVSNVAYLDSFQKPNALKSRRHSGILHHIEEKLGRSVTPTPRDNADDSDDDIEHKASEPIPQSHSKSFMNSFQKPNALKDRRHSGIMHVIESKHQGHLDDDVEYKADPTPSPTKQALPPTSPEQPSRSLMDSFAKPNNSLKERRPSGVFHHQSNDGSKPTTPHGSSVKAPPPATFSRDNSLSTEVSFSASSPHSPQHHYADIMERRQSSGRTPPPPDAIHRVNLLDRKQSGIRGQHLRQNSQSTTDGLDSWTDALDNGDAMRTEPRRRGGTPPPADAIKTVNLLDRKNSGILFSRSRSNSLDVTDTSSVSPLPPPPPQPALQSALRTGQSPVNLIDEMLDPSQMSEEDQIALSIKLSEQEAKYGTNMLEELPRIDPSEIETLESFGYNFGQAVEIIFKEHHDVTQEVSLHADEAALVLPDDALSTASGATYGTTENAHQSNNSNSNNNPLRRRPSNSDLYEAVQQVPSVDTASSYPSSLGYPSKSPSDSYRTMNQPNMRRDGSSAMGSPTVPTSGALYGADMSLRRGGSQANLVATMMMPSDEANRSTRNLVRKSSRMLMDAANAPPSGSSNLARNPPQRIPSQSTMTSFDAQSVTSTQTIEALRYLPPGHHHVATQPYGGHSEQLPRPLSMHGHSSSFHRSSGPTTDQYGNPTNQETYSPPPSSSNELRRHSSHHQMTSHQQPYEDHYYHAPPPQQSSQPLPPPQLQGQPQPALNIDRRLSSSSHSYYDGDGGGRHGGGVAVVSRSSSVNDERGSSGGLRSVPVSTERGHGDPTSPTYGMEPYLGHQFAPPPPAIPPSSVAAPPPKTLTARPSVQNMVPVRVDTYYDVPDSHAHHPSSTTGTTGIYRSSSQEIHRSHSQSFYDQHRPPSQPFASSQGGGSYQPTPRSGGSHYTDPYSPNGGGPHGAHYGISQASYDSIDQHGRLSSSSSSAAQQSYFPHANAPSPLQPSPSHPHYSPPPAYRSMGPPTTTRNGGHGHGHGGSSNSSSSSIIDSMRSDALSRTFPSFSPLVRSPLPLCVAYCQCDSCA